MKPRSNINLFIILLIVLAGIGIIFILQKDIKKRIGENNPSIHSTPSLMRDFEFTEYAANGLDKRYTIKGKKFGVENKRAGFIIFGAAKEAAIRDVEVAFYESKKTSSTISAKRAVLNMSAAKGQAASLSGEMEFEGRVTVITAEHRALTCDSLKWDSAKGRIYASGRCELSDGGKTIRGDTVDSDVALRDYKVGKDRLRRFKELKRTLLQGGLNV